jgi:hypothetical protein
MICAKRVPFLDQQARVVCWSPIQWCVAVVDGKLGAFPKRAPADQPDGSLA